MKLYIGTSGYSYKEWKGKFYPAKLPATKMLHYYSEHFRAVEINSTFRGLPEPSSVKAWMAEVPKDFRFALKAPQRITHMQRLKNADESVRQLLEVAGVLKAHQAPLLFQLPPNFKKDVSRLRDFLELLPPRSRAAFEFRHQSWFEEEIFDLLREHQAALCIADAEGELKVPFVATTDWGYLRLRRPDYPDSKLKNWIKQITKQKWRDAFVFFKHEDEGNGPRFATRFLELSKHKSRATK